MKLIDPDFTSCVSGLLISVRQTGKYIESIIKDTEFVVTFSSRSCFLDLKLSRKSCQIAHFFIQKQVLH